MKRQRLQHLIHILQGVDPERFDMSAWRSEDGPACGTAACALGWAAMDHKFQTSGLTLTCDDDSDTWYPKFGTAFGFTAGANFFGITGIQARDLFDPDYYPVPDGDIRTYEVIERIEALLAGEA